MRRISTLVAFILLLMPAAPMLACVRDAAMSHGENACCVEMHNQCGDMEKHGCCTVTVHTEHSQPAASNTSVSIHWLVLAPVAIVAPLAQFSSGSFHKLPLEHSPPGLLTTQITVLRI